MAESRLESELAALRQQVAELTQDRDELTRDASMASNIPELVKRAESAEQRLEVAVGALEEMVVYTASREGHTLGCLCGDLQCVKRAAVLAEAREPGAGS